LDLIPQHHTGAQAEDADVAATALVEATGGGQSKTQLRLQREWEQAMQPKRKGGKSRMHGPQQQGQQHENEQQEQQQQQQTEGKDDKDSEQGMEGSGDEGVISDSDIGEGEAGNKGNKEEGGVEQEDDAGDRNEEIQAGQADQQAALFGTFGGSSSKSRGRKQLLQTMVFSATLALPAKLHKRLRRGGGGSSGAATLENLMDRYTGSSMFQRVCCTGYYAPYLIQC
jgi:hypothetical protein